MNPYGSPQLPRKEKKTNALRRIPFLHSHSSGAVSLPQSPVGFRRSVEAALSVNDVPSSSSIPAQHGAAFISDNFSRPKGEERACPASPGFPVRSPASPPSSSSSLDATPQIFSSSAPTPTSAYFAALRPTPLSPTAKPVHSDTTHNHNNNRPTPPPVNNRPDRNEGSVRTPLQGQRQFPQPKKPLPPLPPQHAPHQPLLQHHSAPYPSSSDNGEPKAGPSFQLRNAHISFSSGVRRKRFTKKAPGETSGGGEDEGGIETDSDDEHSFVNSDSESYSPSFSSSSSSSYSSSLSSLEALGEESWRDSGEFLSNHNNSNGERSNAAAVAVAFKKRLSSQQQVLGGALAAGHQRGQSPLASSPSSLPAEGGASSSRNSWGALPSSSFQQQQRSVPKRKNSNPWHTWSPHSSSAEGSATSCSLPASPTASSSSVRTVRFSCDPPTKREEAGNDRGEGDEEAKFYYQLLLRQQQQQQQQQPQQQQQETEPCWSQQQHPQQPPQEQHSFASYLALQASPSSSSSSSSALGQSGEEKTVTNMSSTAPISSPPPSPSSRNNNKQQASLLDNDASTLRPVYPKDQQQPQPSLLTLNLYAPEKDVGIKLKFTPASTVEEVLTQTIRRLFSDSPEVRRVPWRLCRRTGSPSSHNNKTKKNSGSWLHVTNPISDYILADEEELDVMKPEQAPILIKVVVMETQGTVTCRVDPETTVWELLQSVLFKVHGRAEHPLDEYGLFTVAGKLLNEEHLLSDYSLVNMSKLEFKRIPQLPEAASPSASTTPTLSVTVINLLELENRTEDGQQQQGQLLTKQMSFPLDISVSDVLSKVIKLFPVKDRHQVALYVPSKRVWLRLDSTLASYSLENDAVLEIRPKYREVTVALPVPTGGKVFETYKFAEEDPAAALYELILFNNPHISDNYTAYTLCTRGGNTLDPKKSIWSYGTNNSRFEVLGKLEPVVVYINGREHKMNVDFTSPVHSIVEMACYKFNLLPVLSVNAMGSGGDDARLQHFVLHSPAGPLVRKSSLRQQGVPTNTTLILKDLREMSGSTGEASQLAPPSTSSSPSPAVSSSSLPAVSSPSRPQANDNLNKGGSKVGPGSLSPSSSSASLSSPPSPASALSSSAPSSTLERGEPKEVELITIGEEKVNIKWLPATLNIGTEDGSYSGDTLETNIWEEEDSAQTVILSQEKGNEEENDSSGITAATLNKLVSYLTAADTHDIRFMKAIMMTYPSFTNPERLLSKLIERYNVPEGYSAAHVKKVQFRVCNVLKHWITKYFDHFDQALLRSLLEFINQSLIKDGHQSSATTLNNLICKKFQDLQNKNPMDEHNQAMYSAKEKPPPPNVIRNIGKKRNKDKSKSKITRGSEISISQFPRNLWECDEEEVARQLTINEFILYSEIKTSELLEQAWMKKEKQHRCPNVLRMIDNFNLTSLWIAHLILQPLRVKERARRWEFFINVASYLYQLNNFNLLMSFISGMNNSCILRLQHTKATLQKSSLQTLIKLETLMAHEGSYKNYRKELRRVAPPCIPYIGVHLSDLVFIEEGNPDEIEGLINWDKRSLVYRVIDLVGQHQNMRYNLTHVPEFSSFFSTANLPTEQELFQTSLQREPRGAARSQIL